jgi:hypothetical protein
LCGIRMMRHLLLTLACLLATAAGHAEDGWHPPVTRTMLEREFVRFDQDHRALKLERQARLQPLQRRLLELHGAGQPMHCSTQIENELRWRLTASTEWSRVDRYLWLLQTSLLDTEQDFAIEQVPHDGSWGVCYVEWFKKLDPAIDALNRYAAIELEPSYPLRFLGPIASPEGLIGQLRELRVSDIAADGRDQRQPLGALMSFAAELVYKPPVRSLVNRRTEDVEIDEAYKAALTRFLDDWQDPATGYWGPWYRIDGELRKAADLSFTYHIVAYRKGEVRLWDKILATTLAIRDEEYPFGWRFRGRDTNHNAYDVVRILKLGWRHLEPDQRARAAVEIDRLLRWSLSETLTPDGRFLPDPDFDGKLSAAYYYGISLLTKTGYCAATPAFWTDQTWPEAAERCCRIAERVMELGSADPTAIAAQQRLEAARPDCPIFAQARPILVGPASVARQTEDEAASN